MLRNFLYFILPIFLGLILGVIDFEPLTRLMATFVEVFKDVFLLTAPIITFLFLAYGIMMITFRGKFLLKYFLILIITLLLAGLFAYLVSVIFVAPIANTPVMIEDAFKPVDPYFGFLDFEGYLPLTIWIILGLVFGFITRPEQKIGRFITVVHKFFAKYFLLILKYTIPVLIVSTFAILVASNKFQEFIIIDFYLSLLIVGSQILWVTLNTFLSSILKNKSFKKLISAISKNYLIGLSYTPRQLAMPFYIDNMEKGGISPGVASSSYVLSSQMSKPGSVIAVIIFSFGIMTMYGETISFLTYLPFILAVTFGTMIAASIPGGVFAVVSNLLTPMLAFSGDMMTLMQVMYWRQGTMNSGANVASDTYLAAYIDEPNQSD